MRTRISNHIKHLLLPCLIFSALAGVTSAIIITAFKLAAEAVIHLSSVLYSAVRENPAWLPVLILGCAALGLIASVILSFSRSCRGGGIPTSITAIRGIVSFNWIKGILLLPISALLTFLCGIPLGTEGPCVQMGTAVGDGVSKCFGSEKSKGWRRYIMTGGASAGFSIATASPLSAIIFSMEELHKRFSPLLLTVVSISVISAQATARLLATFCWGSEGLFHISSINALDLRLLFVPVIIGVICGASSALFSRFYQLTDKLTHHVRKKLHITVLFPLIFALVSVVGFFISDTLGSGHGLIDGLLTTRGLWYVLIIVFLLRMVSMMVANTSGITGGIFLPTLAFGAIIGSLCGNALIALGLLPEEFYILCVVLGISAFLGSTSRIPITACIFAVEALGGIHNVLPIIIATTIALLTVEITGIEDFTDTVIESKIKAIHRGKSSAVIEVALTVKPDSFVVDKELRDILWPNACSIVSFERAPENRGNAGISAGDVITVHYKTYDPSVTAEELTVLVGKQSPETESIMKS